MPLRGIIDNKDVYSFDYTDDDWLRLKKDVKCGKSTLTLNCCKQKGFLRNSSLGLKHFVHQKANSNCDWKPETHEHIQAKLEIIKACRDAGWEAKAEYNNGNWKADVLAEKNGKKIAFEVQWSKQTYEETKYRQERYSDSKVRCCWFFRIPPKEIREWNGGMKAIKDIPSFKIIKDEEMTINVEFDENKIPIGKFVFDLLSGRYKYCSKFYSKVKQEIKVTLFPQYCEKCGMTSYDYAVYPYVKSKCNKDFYVYESLWGEDGLNKSVSIYNQLKKHVIENDSSLNIVSLEKGYSKTTKTFYMQHRCPYCNYLFGDFFKKYELDYATSNNMCIEFDILFDGMAQCSENKHWCYSLTNEHCE